MDLYESQTPKNPAVGPSSRTESLEPFWTTHSQFYESHTSAKGPLSANQPAPYQFLLLNPLHLYIFYLGKYNTQHD